MCKELSDIEIAEDLARYSNEKSQAGGDARKLFKAIRLYEEIAAKLGIKSLNLNDYMKVIK
jgi:hypothetical protein